MVTRNTNIIGAVVLFGLVAAAAGIWGYSMMNQQHREASVEVQQIQERSWGVEVKEMPLDPATPAIDDRKKIVIAEH
jgi:hypothetical protein